MDSVIESEWDSDTKSMSNQKKLIMNHRYVITIDGTNQMYYGTCQCPDLYLFSNVVKFGLMYKYIGLNCFSEKDHFIDTHEKMD
jgi:hypothetical protein